MTALKLALGWLHRRAENLIALLLASLFVSFIIQIVFRYVLNLPLGWTVEYVAIAWLWGILFGYAFVLREGEVIKLDILYLAVPRIVQRAMDVASNLLVAGILVWSFPQVIDYVTFMSIERTAFMRIPFDQVFCIYIPFVISVVIRCLINVWRAVRNVEQVADKSQPSEVEHA